MGSIGSIAKWNKKYNLNYIKYKNSCVNDEKALHIKKNQWLLLEDVEKREPSCTVGGNAN